MRITVQQLHTLLQNAINAGHANRPVVAQGFNESGDFVDLRLTGDIRVDQDAVGNPIIVIR